MFSLIFRIQADTETEGAVVVFDMNAGEFHIETEEAAGKRRIVPVEQVAVVHHTKIARGEEEEGR
jgi:hypothetical protein